MILDRTDLLSVWIDTAKLVAVVRELIDLVKVLLLTTGKSNRHQELLISTMSKQA